MSKHTSLPWHYIDEWRGIYDSPDIRGAQVRIAEITSTPDYKANAEFIVRACNSYYELVEALEAALPYLQDQLAIEKAGLDSGFDKGVVQRDVNKIVKALNKAKGGLSDQR